MCNFITTFVSIVDNYFSKVFGLTFGSLNQMTYPGSIWVLMIYNYWKYGCGVPLNDNIFKSISLTIWKALYTLIRQKLPFGTFLFTLWNGFENLSNHWELALSLSLWFDKPIQNFCSYFLICGPLAWIFFSFFLFFVKLL